MFSGGVGVNPWGYSSECRIQLAPSSVCYAHDLTRIASSPHFLLFRFPFDRQRLVHTARRCQSDCWIEFVQILYGLIFRVDCRIQQFFSLLRLTTAFWGSKK